MDETAYRDFTTAVGEAYCEVVWTECHVEACPQDGYEVFAKLFGVNGITPEKVHAAQVSKSQLTQLRDAARAWQETDKITLEHMQEVLRLILWRWPPDAT